ncbi:hypothetical protein K474DRAFT_1565006, partial [Panus rudis PR-1116 ss-1]
WLKCNVSKRWEHRLRDTPDDKISGANKAQLLVLKSYYNQAWNYFSAKELGDAMLGYWREWASRAQRGEYGYSDSKTYFPAPDEDHDLNYVHQSLLTKVVGKDKEEVWVPDMSRIGILEARTIVSRKRTFKMFDITNHWKRIVFERLEDKVLAEHNP